MSTEFILSTNVQSKAFKGATYKQIQYLKTFDNVEINASSSQIMKRIECSEMSEAIDAAKQGIKVIIE
jgi:hypothetical protein